jgi:hypothetical protein
VSGSLSISGRLPDASARRAAREIALTPEQAEEIATAIEGVPDASELEPNTLVVVLPGPVGRRSLARSVWRALGGSKPVPRAIRCSALLARGYVRLGAGVDPETKDDLVWGFSPAPAASDAAADATA